MISEKELKRIEDYLTGQEPAALTYLIEQMRIAQAEKRESDQRIQGLTLQNDALKSKLREIDSLLPRDLL